jgi:hypothetical protein
MSEIIDQPPPNGAEGQPNPAAAKREFDRQGLIDAVELLRQRFSGQQILTLITIENDMQLISASPPEQVALMLASALPSLLNQLFIRHSQLQASLVQEIAQVQQRFMALKRGQSDVQPETPSAPAESNDATN